AEALVKACRVWIGFDAHHPFAAALARDRERLFDECASNAEAVRARHDPDVLQAPVIAVIVKHDDAEDAGLGVGLGDENLLCRDIYDGVNVKSSCQAVSHPSG